MDGTLDVVILAIIVGTLGAIVYSLKVLYALERRIARVDENIERITIRIAKEELKIEQAELRVQKEEEKILQEQRRLEKRLSRRR
jgi:hypothetical protein